LKRSFIDRVTVLTIIATITVITITAATAIATVEFRLIVTAVIVVEQLSRYHWINRARKISVEATAVTGRN
jgi:hypothetical protein